MLRVSRLLQAFRRSQSDIDKKQEIIDKGDIGVFCGLYRKFWERDPHHRGVPADEFTPEGPCWLWLGEHDKDGYGKLRWGSITTNEAGGLEWDTNKVFVNKKNGKEHRSQAYVSVHRLVWQIANKQILKWTSIDDPMREEIDHKCRVHACFNPAHLEKVLRARNVELIELRKKYNLGLPEDEQAERRQAKFMAEIYVRETKLRNLELALSKNAVHKLKGKKLEKIEREKAQLEEMKRTFDPTAPEPDEQLPGLSVEDAEREEALDADTEQAVGELEDPDDDAKLHLGKSSLDLVKELKKNGWEEDRQTGSHKVFERKYPTGEKHRHDCVVPAHGSHDVSPGVKHSVEKEIQCEKKDRARHS